MIDSELHLLVERFKKEEDFEGGTGVDYAGNNEKRGWFRNESHPRVEYLIAIRLFCCWFAAFTVRS